MSATDNPSMREVWIDRTPRGQTTRRRTVKWCVVCGVPFLIAPWYRDDYTTCSPGCSQIRRCRTASPWDSAWDGMKDRTPSSYNGARRTQKRCSVCSDEFLIAPGLARAYATCSPECGRISRAKALQGDRNYGWLGDGASAKALHAWLTKNVPKRGVCLHCGEHGRTDYAFLRHPEPHTRDRADYVELCPPCHRQMDLESGHVPLRRSRDATTGRYVDSTTKEGGSDA